MMGAKKGRAVIDAAVSEFLPMSRPEFMMANIDDTGPNLACLSVRLDQGGLRDILDENIEELASTGLRANYGSLIRIALKKFVQAHPEKFNVNHQ